MTLSSRQLLWSCLTLVSLATGVTSQAVPAAGDADCPADLVTFEVITGNIRINIQKKLLKKDKISNFFFDQQSFEMDFF